MIEIKPATCEDEEYDVCGSTTFAVLKVDRISIPLCCECLDELNNSLSEFNNTIFCYKCEHFIMSKWGLIYGGSCKKDLEIDIKDAGYINCVDAMHTCKDAKLLEVRSAKKGDKSCYKLNNSRKLKEPARNPEIKLLND